MDKHSSLLRKFVNYGEKKFYNIGPRGVIYDRNILIIQVTDGEKSFISSVPWEGGVNETKSGNVDVVVFVGGQIQALQVLGKGSVSVLTEWHEVE